MYEVVGKPMVASVVGGYNCTIFAYGQTGSGKTHTMLGKLGDVEQQGVIPRMLSDIFTALAAAKQKQQLNYTVGISFVEIYMEKVRDLLTGDVASSANKDLKIREGIFCHLRFALRSRFESERVLLGWCQVPRACGFKA